MYPANSVVQAIAKNFFLKKKTTLTEFEAQECLYNIQKEAYRQTGKPLIMEQFYADPNGPFIPRVRQDFPKHTTFREPVEMDAVAVRIIEKVLASSSRPPTKDFAWQKARVPLSPGAEKANPIQEEWIAEVVALECVRDDRIGLRA